jgi:hypothetical protein
MEVFRSTMEVNKRENYVNNIIANLALENLDIDINNEEEKEKWKITDDNTADWALDIIREANAEYNRFEMVVKAKIEQLQNALQKAEEERNRTVNFFEFKLYEYFNSLDDKVLKKTKTQKTYKLPTGKLKLKKREPEFKREDDKLLEWLKERNMRDYIEIKEKPKWGDLKKTIKTAGNRAISADGEIIEGITVIERPDEFKVELI